MDDLVRRARDFLVGVSKGPWAYRPQEFDDWGYVRQADPDAEGWRHFICQVKSPMLSDDGLNDCRKRGIDPWGRDAKFIAESRDLIPAMADRIEALTADNERLQARVDALEDENRRLREFENEQIKYRAQHWLRRNMSDACDGHVLRIGEAFGFGAVMDSASRLWARKEHGQGAFYIGGCIGFSSDEAARSALKETGDD